MNSSLEILSRRLRLLCSLILLYALTICISAAKFCVSETSRDSARAARFCVKTRIDKSNFFLDSLVLRVGAREKSVKFFVSNYDDEIGVSEVKIKYDLVFTLPKEAADIIELELYFQNQSKDMQRTDEGKNAVFTCPGVGIFEAGVKSEHSYSLLVRVTKFEWLSNFDLNCSVSARQIFSEG